MTSPRHGAPSFGERLKEHRRAAGLTQRQLGDAVGWDFTYVSKIEKPGGPRPTRDKVERAADVLQLSAAERDELLRLAEMIPSEVERLMVRDPVAVDFYRAVANRMTDAQRERYLRDLISQLDRDVDDAGDAGDEDGDA